MNIQPVSKRDFPRIVEVWEASVRATHDFLPEEDIVYFKKLVPGFLGSVTLLGVRDKAGNIAAFLGVAENSVEMLFVHPDSRGKGVGRALLEYAVHQLGANTVEVNEQNQQAVGFYLRMGFEVTGRSDVDGLGKPYPLLRMRIGT